mgnify:CR=1 FL=1
MKTFHFKCYLKQLSTVIFVCEIAKKIVVYFKNHRFLIRIDTNVLFLFNILTWHNQIN